MENVVFRRNERRSIFFYCHYLYILYERASFFALNGPCDREAQLSSCPSLLFFLSWFFCMLDLGVTAEQREVLSSDHTDSLFLPHFLYINTFFLFFFFLFFSFFFICT